MRKYPALASVLAQCVRSGFGAVHPESLGVLVIVLLIAAEFGLDLWAANNQ